jgi:16S rRNA (guanine527-N7)-methyltransferase
VKWTEAEQAHLEVLARWRTAMNLVGPGPLEPHFEDSQGAVECLEASGAWVDLGSGAGFPGVALAAHHPAARVLLVESRQKRAAFLAEVVRASGLDNLSVFHGRTEAVAPGFDGVIARAYRPPEEYLRDAERLLLPSGVAVLLSGDTPEVPAGWEAHSSRTYPVGDGTRVRTVVARTD